MKTTSGRVASLLAGIAAAAVITAPIAAAANSPSCLNTGGSTDCHTPGNAQIYAAPHARPSVGPGNQPNPKWSGLGYNPRWNGFKP